MGDLMTECRHHRLDVQLEVHHPADSNVKHFEIRAKCEDCAKPMEFLGVPGLGVSFENPTVSVDGIEIRLPLVAHGEAPAGNRVGYALGEERRK